MSARRRDNSNLPLSPIRRNDNDELRQALCQLDTEEIPVILGLNPSLFTLRNSDNQNLPLHDLFDQYFTITNEIKQNPLELIILVQKISYIGTFFINFPDIAEIQLEAGGLLELNREKIDFVNYRSRTPMDLLLIKFEEILELCNSDYYDGNNSAITMDIDVDMDPGEIEGAKVSILDTMKEILRRCIEVCKEAWKAKGRDNVYTIMNTAVGVFPLLKVQTLQYLIANFEINNNLSEPCRDLLGRSLLSNMICEATKRTQWGDWKERFRMILEMEFGKQYCWARDGNGQLPIHVALEKGLKWNNGMEELISADALTLSEPHPVNGLYPFEIAATCFTSENLDLIFNLLTMNPLAVIRRRR
jgi:hypothetical protein